MLWPYRSYLKIWVWDLIFGHAVKLRQFPYRASVVCDSNDLPPWLTRQCVSCFEVSSFFSSTIFWHPQYWILLSSTVQIRHQSCLFCCQFLLLVSLWYPHVSTASWDWLTPFLHVNQLRNPPIKQNNGEVLPDLMKPDNYGDQRQMLQYIPENSIT